MATNTMKFKVLLGSFALSFALGACSKGGGGDVAAFIKLDTEKGEAFKAGGDDCAAKAKSVGDWRSKNTAKYKELQTKLKKDSKEIMEKHGDQLKANKKAVMDAMMACTNDPAFSKMMDDTKAE